VSYRAVHDPSPTRMRSGITAAWNNIMKTSHVLDREFDRDTAAPDRHRVVALAPDTIAEGVRRLGWIALVYAIGHITAR
jgi:hypothetical protein